LAARALVGARRVAVDLLDFLLVIVGSAASGSLAVVADGSLGVAAGGALSGTGIAGAAVTGCVTSGAAWASKGVEERARTAAIAVIAGRNLGVLCVMI
jgi:hypothetical protein